MTDGRRPKQDTGDRDGNKMSQVFRPNSSHSGYGKNMSSFPGSKRSEHFQGSGSIYFFLEPLSFSHEYTKKRNGHVLGRP